MPLRYRFGSIESFPKQALAWAVAPHDLGMVAHACNRRTGYVKVGISETQGDFYYTECQASLGMRHCLKINKS